MSTQVVMQTNNRVVTRTKPTSASTPFAKITSSQVAAKLERIRNPPKPAITVDKSELKKQLTPLQYRVTQDKFTERPFSGEYLRLNDEGKYCCVVCGEEIFSSETKYDSGCGWPAFFDVLTNDKVLLQADLSHVGGNLLLLALNQDLARTEVLCAKCGAHIGHVFNDGPKPSGIRYCVNSASLKFKKQCETNCDLVSNNSLDNNSIDQTLCSDNSLNCSDSSLSNNSMKIEKGENLSVINGQVNPLNKRQSFFADISSLPKSAENKQTFHSTVTPKSIFLNSNVPSMNAPNPAHSNFYPKSNIISNVENSCDKKYTTKNDVNNNKITVSSKYSGVKSRYLNHLDTLSKQSVLSRTVGFKKSNCKPFLETDL